MQSTLTVFVCSTFADLTEEREAVLNAIRRLKLQHDSMEFFGARAGQPIETCLEEVRKSDILVVIVGHRYGSLVPDLGISYSEAEYQEGYRLDKPCLVYVRNDDVPILPRHMERDPDKLRLLERWKATLSQRHTVASYEDGNRLAVQVAADLGRTLVDMNDAARTRAAAEATLHASIIDEIAGVIAPAIDGGVGPALLLSAIRRAVAQLMTTEGVRKPKLFLSYANSDRAIVREIATGLRAHNIDVWFDELSLAPGAEWVREIARGLDSADALVFFISPNSVGSGWAKQELQIALHRQFSEKNMSIIPVLLADADVPPLLRSIQWLDMRDRNVNVAVKRLAEAIEHHAKRRAESEA